MTKQILGHTSKETRNQVKLDDEQNQGRKSQYFVTLKKRFAVEV